MTPSTSTARRPRWDFAVSHIVRDSLFDIQKTWQYKNTTQWKEREGEREKERERQRERERERQSIWRHDCFSR